KVCVQNKWRQELANGCPGSVYPLIAEKRTIGGDTFCPTVNTFTVRGDEQNAATVNPPKTCFEEMLQRHLKLAQRDGFDSHFSAAGVGSCSCALACCHSDSSSSMVALAGPRPEARSWSSIH